MNMLLGFGLEKTSLVRALMAKLLSNGFFAHTPRLPSWPSGVFKGCVHAARMTRNGWNGKTPVSVRVMPSGEGRLCRC